MSLRASALGNSTRRVYCPSWLNSTASLSDSSFSSGENMIVSARFEELTIVSSWPFFALKIYSQ